MVDASALVLSEVFPPTIGGSGELLFNTYRRIDGLSVRVLTDSGDGTTTDEGDDRWRVRREPMRAPAWGLLQPVGFGYHVRRALRVWRLSRQSRAIVHCARALPEGVDAWLARRVGGAPYVCWVHGEDVATAQSSREFAWLTGTVLAGSAAVIANSRNTAGLLTSVGVGTGHVDVVYPGVDAERFRPDVPGAAQLRRTLAGPGELLILTVGRMQRRKGHDLVLKALRHLRNEGTAVRYVVVGDGEERERLETLAIELAVRDLTTFVGVVSAEELPAYYAAADVFCHPNRVDARDVEGFGIVFLEAAAAELPVVGGDSGGVPEAVEAGVTGVLVTGTSAAELAGVLGQLAADPQRRRAMGLAGRARAVQGFSWQRAAARVAAVHRRVAESWARG